MEPQLSKQSQIRRVGLLSPTSGNLGNATMQSAMIANLRKRIAGVEILGITLNPEDTRRRHGIDAFPLAATSLPHYGLVNSERSHTRHAETGTLAKIKRWLKKIPVLRTFLKIVRTAALELIHFAAAAGKVRKLDAIIIPGGGALDDFWGGPWGHPWILFKWSLLARVYGVPFLFVSIGKSSLDHPLSRFFVRTALRFAAYRSYRDQESKKAVQALIDARNDPVFPDLAFSYPRPTVPTTHHMDTPDGRLVVGISPIAYCDPRTWPLKDAPRYIEYIGQLAEMVTWLLRQGYRVIFFTTDSPDAATVDDIKLLIESDVDAGAIQTLPGSMEQSPDSLLQGISCTDLTIASRLHGVILSHLNTTPVLALSFDPKVDAHMEAMGQQDYCLDIDHLQLDRLTERFNALKALREQAAANILYAAQSFRQLLDEQYDWIFGAPHPGSAIRLRQNRIDASPLLKFGGRRKR